MLSGDISFDLLIEKTDVPKATIDQILQAGIVAHKEGNLTLAAENYNAVLKIDKKHPDANHNIGVLKVSSHEEEQALPFFKIALEGNPSKAQFWLSYISCLLQLNKFENAKALLNLAKKRGAKGNGFDQLEQKLLTMTEVKNPSAEKLAKLRSLFEKQQYLETLNYAIRLSTLYPNSTTVMQFQGAALHGLGKVDDAIEIYERLVDLDPNLFSAYNNLSVLFSETGQLDQALDATLSAINIQPDSDIAYYNLGEIYNKLHNYDQALAAYQHSIKINPRFSAAHHALGNLYFHQGTFEKAIGNYNSAIDLDPTNVKSVFGLAVANKKTGNIQAAMHSFHKALSIAPYFKGAYESYLALSNQLISTPMGDVDLLNNEYISRNNIDDPIILIHFAIRTFLQGNLGQTNEYLQRFIESDASILEKLPEEQQHFCAAYYKFLTNLLLKFKITEPLKVNKNTIYHIGESHSLSYAHHNINLDGRLYNVLPRLTLGAKVFHFSQPSNNQYKAITQTNFDFVPSGSTIFISFGEIDCRYNEGLIKILNDMKTGMSVYISKMIQSYLDWFSQLNNHKNHNLFFFTVPAPLFRNHISRVQNATVSDIIQCFNSHLRTQAAHRNFKVIDVYEFTVSTDGFSNRLYHVDDYHLGPSAIKEIELQLSRST